jgi:hypothetical protein
MSEHPMIAWWAEQLGEIEAVAMSAKPGRWRDAVGGDALWDQASVEPGVTLHPEGGPPWGSVRDRETAQHIAFHDPEGVLASVAADRALIEEHAPRVNWKGDVVCSRCIEQDVRMYRAHWRDAPWPCRTVRLRVSAYRHRPGYLGEWAP